jgi:hypothetical protein
MAEAAPTRTPDGSLRVDIYLWLTKTSLDIIGYAGNAQLITVPLEVKMPTLPGFNHTFGSLRQVEPPEMSEWLRKTTTFDPFSFKFLIPTLFPPARLIVRPPPLG